MRAIELIIYLSRFTSDFANHPLKNCAQYNRLLEMGANLRELIVIENYFYKRFGLRGYFNYLMYGIDDSNSSSGNIGNDVYKSYITRSGDYVYFTCDAMKTKLCLTDVRIARVLDPKIKLHFEMVLINGSEISKFARSNISYMTFGLRSYFGNFTAIF